MLGCGPKEMDVQLKMANRDKLDQWMNERRTMGRDMRAIKGLPPEGSTYSDGELITHPVNIAWEDTTTGEVFAIEYETPPNVAVSGRLEAARSDDVGRSDAPQG